MTKVKISPFIIDDFSAPPDFPQWEEKIIAYWDKEHIFAQSLAQTRQAQPWVFYDGPPFATGLPHYGHLLASTTKDVLPRFQTMRGRYVERIWGWDCHGLPIENIVEKQLALPDRQAIETYGVAKFCESCRAQVQQYVQEWQKTIHRLGRFVDMEHAYKTMDVEFMDSEWRVFGQLWDKGLVYQDFKSMHICPRCSTPLSNFEVTLGYKEVTDISVYVKFRLARPADLNLKGDVFFVAWTTTPWTLPGNLLLAVNNSLEYAVVKTNQEYLIMARDRVETVMANHSYRICQILSGRDLVGHTYLPLLPYLAQTPNAFRVVDADFVTTEDGSGIVHLAPAYGEDDFIIGKREGLAIKHHVDLAGKIMPWVKEFAGLPVRPLLNHTSTDVLIIKYLAQQGSLWRKQKIKHAYPHCWRCDYPLLNYATSSFFIKVSAFKAALSANNQKINWLPSHFRDGRMGNWLAGARDWAISRNRFWGTPIPLWRSDRGDLLCVSSQSELEKLTGQKIPDLHKHFVDQLEIKKDGQTYHRVSEVFDCWYESGSMPYFLGHFPADFISEGQDQTRGWFYTLLVLSSALKNEPAFKNVIASGIILAADGKKMSKKLNNYPEPSKVFNQFGADALRLYLMTAPVMKAENLNFSEADIARLRRQVLVTTWNVLAFGAQSFALRQTSILKKTSDIKAWPILDRYWLARTQQLLTTITHAFASYQVIKAGRALIDFAAELSTFYLRLSRERLKTNATSQLTFKYSLHIFALVCAPIMPFFAELLYHNLGGKKKSVHLETWPTKLPGWQEEKNLVAKIDLVKAVITLGQSVRRQLGLKTRQPLASLTLGLTAAEQTLLQDETLTVIILTQLNVKKLYCKKATALAINFDTKLTPALKAEGQARELMRQIADERKKLGLKPTEKWTYTVANIPLGWREEIEAKTNTRLKID